MLLGSLYQLWNSGMAILAVRAANQIFRTRAITKWVIICDDQNSITAGDNL